MAAMVTNMTKGPNKYLVGPFRVKRDDPEFGGADTVSANRRLSNEMTAPRAVSHFPCNYERTPMMSVDSVKQALSRHTASFIKGSTRAQLDASLVPEWCCRIEKPTKPSRRIGYDTPNVRSLWLRQD